MGVLTRASEVQVGQRVVTAPFLQPITVMDKSDHPRLNMLVLSGPAGEGSGEIWCHPNAELEVEEEEVRPPCPICTSEDTVCFGPHEWDKGSDRWGCGLCGGEFLVVVA